MSIADDGEHHPKSETMKNNRMRFSGTSKDLVESLVDKYEKLGHTLVTKYMRREYWIFGQWKYYAEMTLNLESND